jgi:HTH-type transcriptional regulator, competence development regulator
MRKEEGEMKLHIDRARLRERILRDADLNIEAGFPLRDVEALNMFVSRDLVAGSMAPVLEMAITFGTLIELSRRQRKLTVEELAQKARVDVAELVAIEKKQTGHVPKPRTIHQLATFLRLPEKGLMKLSGAVVTRDERLRTAALRFAAKSAGLDKLTKSEEELLHEIVKCLTEQSEESPR